jgi:outer membrane protein
MKYFIRLFFAILICTTGITASAQKFGYVDTKYILSHMPEYQAAQNEINKLSSKWQQEIEDKYAAIERLEQSYQAEKILLTDEMKKKREEEIETKRQEAKEMQKKKFGVDGELFKKREELIKPIQDKIFEAIVDVSSQSSLMCVFDKANHSNLLYTNPKHDISDKVLKKMGLKPGDVLEDEEESKDAGGKDADPNKSGGNGGGGKDSQQAPPQKGGSVPVNRGGKP